MHNIVVIGGNFSGVAIAQHLLKQVLPLVNNPSAQYKVILISPSAQTYFKVGAPRLLASDAIPVEKAFASIPDGFRQYSSDEFAFVQGEAVQVNDSTKAVTVQAADKTEKSVAFGSLVIATGTTSASALWTLHGSHEITIDAFRDTQSRLALAKSILVAGGGPAGVETAGELASRYKNKTVTLVSGGSRLLPRLQNTNVAAKAEKQLQALGVKVLHGVRVTSSEGSEKSTLAFTDGSTRTVDLYIDATGGTPNTGFLPVSWLDGSKRVITDETTLRATNAIEGVYAVGDVASFSNAGIPDAVWPIGALGYSIWSDLHKSAAQSGTVKSDAPGLKEKKYKQVKKDMSIVPIGPSGGVGSVFGWGVPSWLVWLVKSRTFMLDNAPKIAAGYA